MKNLAKKDDYSQSDIKIISVKDYLDYSTTNLPVMQIRDLVDLPVENNMTDFEEETKPRLVLITTNIANRIEDETAKFWTSKKVIRSLIREINKRSVFNFIKNMLTISESETVLSDYSKYISYYELKWIVYNMLTAAEDLGFADSSKYIMLSREYDIITKVCSKNPNRGIDKKTLDIINMRLENLFEYMSRTMN